ncbi:hypothetical protein [Actinomadura rupiterrae]|uniref:hypothetical protein n=1 Tax=Actinomadura rupiterrae TaxID=559627 RepID=UPI0020A5A088|nr:hypothetical protein [Actinomadura rupiterrae]MCP2338491.1 hypothetical protein [Actinomadura rupiterrae]
MPVSKVRASVSAAAAAVLALTLAASPADAAPADHAAGPARLASGVDRNVLLSKAQQPPVDETWGDKPYVDPYFEPSISGPSCWEYGKATGALDGLNARYSTPTWYYNYNEVWVFADSAHAASFEQRWKDLLATCVQRSDPNSPTQGTVYVTAVNKVGTESGVDVWRLTAGITPYPPTTHWQVAVVRQGRAVYAMDLLDYRHGEPAPIPFADSITAIKQKLATYYP